jgi:flagellar basal-body rod modification protein FlgD
MSVSAGIDSLRPATEAYSASASVADGGIEASSTTVTGDRDGGLFTPQKELGKQDFLELLVAQLQFQDPLSPMENTEFVAQLAQFSALEGNYNIEKALGKLDESFQSTVSSQQASAQSMTNASAVSLIGKQVRLRRSSLPYSALPGEEVPIRVHVGEASSATVRILDGEGEVVCTLEGSDKDAENSVTILWDGMRDDGQRAQPGTYAIEVAGQDVNPALYSFVQNEVQGVRFTPQGPLVKIAGQELPIGDIMSVSMAAETVGGKEGMSPSSAVELLGRNVRFQRDQVYYGGQPGQQTSLSLNMGGARRAAVELVDAAGTVVRRWSVTENADGTTSVVSDGTSDVQERTDGEVTISWDGRLPESQDYAPEGIYHFRLADSGANPWMYLYDEGRVTGVSAVAGGTELRVGGRSIPLSAVIGVSLPTKDEA